MISNEWQRTINGLGAIPTDFELATIYGYTPVQSGWIYAHKHGPIIRSNADQMNGLGNPDMPPNTPPDIAQKMLENQNKQVLLQTVTTIALVILAGISIFRNKAA